MSRYVTDAAIAWWEEHRPCCWSEIQHHDNPSINTCSSRESTLALEVSAYILRRNRAANRQDAGRK